MGPNLGLNFAIRKRIFRNFWEDAKTRKAFNIKALRAFPCGAPGGIRTPDTLLKRQEKV